MHPVLSADDVILAGIIGPIGEPKTQQLRFDRLGDVDAVGNMAMGVLSRLLVGRRGRAEFVNLVLKEVGVDGADLHAILFRDIGGCLCVNAQGKVPQHMHRHGRTTSGVLIDDAGIGELLVNA